ncbi:MAG: DUF1205 domain-containing protein [Nocardioides alkalitolerans]
MRVLLVSYAERTQAEPLVPLAWALRCAGHDVLVATQPELVETLADSGLPVVAVGRSLPLYRLWDHAEHEGDADGDLDLVDPTVPLDWDTAAPAFADLVQWWFRTANEPLVGDLVALCREWEPDLVVWETITVAGAVAARACGVPHVRFLWTYDFLASVLRRLRDVQPPGAAEPLTAWLATVAARFGVEPDPAAVTGDATITFLPAALRRLDDPDLTYLPMRFVPYAGPVVVPDWVHDEPTVPRACVTLGTSALDRFGRLVVPAATVVRGVAAVAAEVLVTLDGPEDAGLDPAEVPDHVRFVGRVPLDAVLRTCDLVVHHGGPGTAMTAVAAGVPALVVPEEFDAPVLARLLADTGAALRLSLDELTEASVAEAARRLLDDPAIREETVRLRTALLGMPSPHDLVDALERLVEHPAPCPETTRGAER